MRRQAAATPKKPGGACICPVMIGGTHQYGTHCKGLRSCSVRRRPAPNLQHDSPHPIMPLAVLPYCNHGPSPFSHQNVCTPFFVLGDCLVSILMTLDTQSPSTRAQAIKVVILLTDGAPSNSKIGPKHRRATYLTLKKGIELKVQRPIAPSI